MKRLLVLAFAALLTACAGTGGGSSPQQTLAQFTVTDLQAADADAKAHKDTVASTCYEALIPVVQGLGSGTETAPVGAVSAFQAARDLSNTAHSIPATIEGLNVPCAPLVLSTQQTVLGLGALVGGTAAAAAALAPK